MAAHELEINLCSVHALLKAIREFRTRLLEQQRTPQQPERRLLHALRGLATQRHLVMTHETACTLLYRSVPRDDLVDPQNQELLGCVLAEVGLTAGDLHAYLNSMYVDS